LDGPNGGKGERIEVCFEIKGSGEVDGDILNKFHGVHFGDEIESDELPEAAPEEVAEEVTEEAESSEATSEDDPVDAAPTVTWREDVLLRVMESHEISVEDRDAFVAHAINFDHDDNGYLKKAELEDAAKAWTTDSSEEDGEEEVVNAEEETGESQEKVCPVCSANTPADAITCASCGWTFES
jgi:ribosomal protein L40E